MKNQFPRSWYIPKGALKISAKNSTAVAYVYETQNGRFGAVAFQGKAEKPAFNYTFRKATGGENYVRNFFGNVRDRELRRVDDRTKRAAFVHNVQVGDIYRTSWGYDQTNVEFFEVIEVKGKYAIVREIGCAVRQDGQGCETVVPQSGAFLEPRYKGDDAGVPIRRLIQEHGIKIDDVRHASPWGERVAGVVVGRGCYRTASGWGH